MREMTDRERNSCLVLDHTPEQMATLQRENHRGDITVLRLKSPLKDTNSSARKDKVCFIYHQDVSKLKILALSVPTRPSFLHCIHVLCKNTQCEDMQKVLKLKKHNHI